MPPRAPRRVDVRFSGADEQPSEWDAWTDAAHAVLVDEMRRQKLTYKQLSARLAKLGLDEPEDRLSRRVTRKGYSAAFWLACLAALDVDVLKLVGDARRNPQRQGAAE